MNTGLLLKLLNNSQGDRNANKYSSGKSSTRAKGKEPAKWATIQEQEGIRN
jgi:hypothetical protein